MTKIFLTLILTATMFSVGCGGRLVLKNDNLKNIVTHDATNRKTKRKIHAERTDHYYLWGIISSEPHVMADMINEDITRGERIVNLEIRRKSKPVQIALCYFTAGIYCPEQIVIDGDIL